VGLFQKKPGWVFWVVFFYKNPASRRSLEYVRSRFTLAHLLEPELPSAIKYFFKYNSYHIECFFEAMDLHRTLNWNSNPVDSHHSNFKRTINCPVNRANIYEPSTQRFTLSHSLEPELLSAMKYFLDIIHTKLNVFFEAMDLHRTLNSNYNPVDSSHSRIISNERKTVQLTRADMNQLSTQKTNWRCHCSVTW